MLCALLLMSMASWIVIVLKVMQAWRLHHAATWVPAFWQSGDLDATVDAALDHSRQAPRNPFAELALRGREAAAQHGAAASHLPGRLDISDGIARALQAGIDQASGRLQAGLAVLASVGATAPFVGLFGTVWGIYHALMRIGAAGQASIDQVAGPIGEALIMTALGLAVAIPAVLGYNALVRANKRLLHKLRRFTHELHAFYAAGARAGQPLRAHLAG